ncbi:hypothetical protein NDU88_004368 [Pleurodeles waltl]|uniref:Uncharacterized protein n=1 Tax=Pleurodeles waltl TaxID=8319 RepID=A0AAV7M921_PLEWA|nr:hypothetical protein NDU88_004368 [Pleurodeles waltl]
MQLVLCQETSLGPHPLVELRDSEGNLQSGKEHIMRSITDFYGVLYSPKSSERSQVYSFLKGIPKTLSPEEREGLNAPFTLEELHLAAMTSKICFSVAESNCVERNIPFDLRVYYFGTGEDLYGVWESVRSKDQQRQVRNSTTRPLDPHQRPTAISHQAGLPEDPRSLVQQRRHGGEIMGQKTVEDEAEAGTLEPPEADDRREVFGPAERDPASAPVHRTNVASATLNGQVHHENLRMSLREEHRIRKPCQLPDGTLLPVAKVEVPWMGRVGERRPLQLANPMVVQKSGEVH